MANWWTEYKKKNGVDKEAKEARQRTAAPQSTSSGQTGSTPKYTPSAATVTAAQSPTWWEDYKRTNDIYGESRAATDHAAYMEQKRVQNQQSYEQYQMLQKQLDMYHSADAIKDNVSGAVDGFFSSSDNRQRKAIERGMERYERDLPLYQQMLEKASYSKPLYERTYNQAAGAGKEISDQYSSFMEKMEQAEAKRLEALKQSNLGTYYAETMSREELRQKANEAKAALDAADAEYNSAASISSAGYASMAPSYQTDLKLGSSHDQERRDRQAAIDAAEQKRADAQAQLAVFEAALRYQDDADRRKRYFTNPDSDQNFTKQAGWGRSAFENDWAQHENSGIDSGKNATHTHSSGATFGGQGGKIEPAYASMSAMDRLNYVDQIPPSERNFLEKLVAALGGIGNESTDTTLPMGTMQASINAMRQGVGMDEMQSMRGRLAELDDDLQERFYYFYANDPTSAMGFLDAAEQEQHDRDLKKLQSWSEEHPILGTLGAAGVNMLSGADFLSALAEKTATGEIGEHQPSTYISEYRDTMHEGVQNNINSDLGKFLYQVGTSLIDSTVARVTGNTVPMFFMSAASSEYLEAKKRGASDEQALLSGTLSGLAECVFEEISVEKLINQDIDKSLVRRVLEQSFTEASEELTTSLANTISDTLLSRAYDFETKTEARARELMEHGMSAAEAKQQAGKEWALDVLRDAASGFVSGGASTLIYSGTHNGAIRRQNRDNEAVGADVREQGQIEALQKYAEDNNLGWYAKEQSTQAEGTPASATEENTGEQRSQEGEVQQAGAETRETKRQERQQIRDQRKRDRQVGSDTQRVQTHIQEQLSGKSAEEQTGIRDQLREKYGDGILPSVYQAVTREAARHAGTLKGTDAILEARNKAMSQTGDAAMKDAIARGYDNVGFVQAAAKGKTQAAGRYVQQARNNKAGALRLEASVSSEGGQGETVSIVDMSKDGKKAVLSDGRSVNPEQLTELGFEAETADVVGMLSRFGMGEKAGAVLQTIAKKARSADGYRYALEYATAWDQGRQGILSATEAAKRSSLDADTVWEAYEAGKNARLEREQKAEAAKQAAVQKATGDKENGGKGRQIAGTTEAKKTGTTGRKGSVTISKAVDRGSFTRQQTRDLEVVTKLAEFCGADIVLEGSEIGTDEKGRAVYVGAHGWYADGVIHLDVNAGKSFVTDAVGSLLATTGHELCHFMQDYAPKHYAKYRAAVLEAIVKIDGERTLERLIAEEQKNSTREGGLDKIAAEDEVVADASQKRMGDRAFWEAVIEAAGQENRSSIQRAFDWLKEWFGKIREAVTGFDKYTDAARILDKAERSVQDSLGQLFAEGMSEAVRTHDLVGDIKNTAREGGEVRHMLRGVNKDGIEVYETSDTVMNMSEVDRKQKYLDMMKNQYLGRAARFTRNGHIFYAIFDPNNHRKPIYGDKRNSRAGYKAMLRAAAEGDFFDLVENSEYSRSSKNRKSHTNADYFDYFIKTVQIDNKVYDLIADVEKFYYDGDGGYIYTLALTDNKTIKASPATHPAQGGTVNTAGGALTNNSIAQPAQNGNTQNQNNSSDPHMERSYEQGSDLELMAEAAESLSEAGGEEYWAALLESAPELAEDRGQLNGLMKDYRAQAKRLAEAEAKLAEAKRQLTTTNRKLNTRGIAGLSQDIMKALGAGDAKNRGVAKQLTQILTEAYQKGLDAIDRGEEAGKVWDVVWSEGIEKAADYLLENATHSEKYSYSWTTTSLGQYMTGEDGRWAALDIISAKVVTDWSENRMRGAVQETAADRITERVEKRMQKQVDAATERAATAEQANEKLQRDLDFWKSAQEKASEQVSFLDERLREARAELRDSQRATAKEKKAKADRIRSMDAQIKAKRQEAQAWKELAARNESLLRAALRSKNADIQALRTQMDKNADAAAKAQAALVLKLEQQAQRERDILAGKLKPLAMQRLLKAERERAAEKMAAHKDEVFAAQKDRKKATALRSRIGNLKAELQKRLANPSDRSYVPAGLATALVDALDAIDNSPREGTQAAAKYASVSESLRALASAYDDISTDEDVGYEYRSEFDPELRDQIKELAKTMQGRNLRELTVAELEQVYDAVKSIRDSMRNAAKLLNSEQWASVYEAIESIVGQQQSMTPIADAGKAEARKRRRLLDNLSPMRAVEMMANWDRDAALYQLFQAVEQGGVDEMSWIMGYNKSLQDLKTGKNEKSYREALTKLHDYGAKDKTSGKAVQMTQMQAIQLYMTWQRERANDKLVHLQKGGATIRDALAVMDGKGSKAASHTVEVTPELIGNIEQSLSAWDRAYMEEIRNYLTREARETNKVLYQLKHRVLTTEAAYVPYVVDKGYLESKLEGSDVFNLFVKTPGSTNALQKRAPQPVIIDGMDTLMSRHVQEQARYIGLAVPIRDFAKVFNGRLADPDGGVYTSLKKTIEDNFGEDGTHLILQALLDAQGGSKGNSWSSHIAETLNKLQGSFVKAALLVNPSVTIKQAASYVAAESVLSHRALTAGNRAFAAKGDASHSPGLIAQLFAAPEGRTARRLYEEIDAHTSMHYQRRQGMSYTELANEAQRSGKLRRTMNAVGAQMEQSTAGHKLRKAGEMLNPVQWIQRMDVATTAALWVAAKEQAGMDGLRVGSEEYWQHTTELYERCLRETQPMYDGLHRNSHQKQGGGLMQYLFPFRTVPIQNHGQIASAFEALRASKNKSEAKQAEARRFFIKTAWAQTESAAVFAFMTFLAAVLKRKTKKYRDDETEELTAGSLLKGLGLDAASTLFSVAFPMWGSEAWSIGDRAVSKLTGKGGYTFDAFSVGAVDLLNDLASSGDKLFADAGKLMRGEDVTLSDVGDHALAMLLKTAKVVGVPADTVKTYVAGTIGNIEDIAAGRIPALNDESWERKAGVNAARYLRAWDAGDDSKMEEVIREMRQTYLNDGKEAEKADELTRNALSSAAMDVYKAGGMDLDELAELLEGTGLWEEEKLSNKIKSLLREEYKAGNRSEADTISGLTELCGMDPDKAWKTAQEWEAKAEHEGDEDYSYSEYENLRDALDDGKSLEDAGADYLAHGYTEKQVREAAVEHLRQRYADGELSEEEAVELLKDYQRKKEKGEYREITVDEAYFTIREWEANEAHEGDEDYSYKKYETVYQTIDANGDLAPVIRELTAHGVSEKQIRSEAKSYLVEKYEAGAWKEAAFKNYLSRYCQIAGKEADEIANASNCYKETGHRLGELNEDYLDGSLTAEKAKQILIRFGGKSSDEAGKRLRWLDLKKQDPSLEINEATTNRYYDGTDKLLQTGHRTAMQTGMSAKQFAEAMEILSKVTGVDRDGDGRSDDTTRERAYIAAIAAMNLTPAQKDALYYAEYMGANRKKGVYPTW